MIIGVVPRERFAATAAVLQRLFEVTAPPFRLIVVDCAMPRCYREAVDRVLMGHANVEIIHHDEYLRPNQSRNLVVRASKGSDWICLMDNDVFVKPEWLPKLVRACEEEEADVATPLIIEGDETGPIHFDERLGCIRRKAPWISGRWIIKKPSFDYKGDRLASRRRQDVVEDHCLLYRSETLARISPFDESLNTRELVDLSMRLHTVGARVIFEPSARVVFVPPPPIEPEEREFYSFRWELNRAVYSNQYVERKWRISGLPNSLNFIQERLSFLNADGPTSSAKAEEESSGNRPSRQMQDVS